MNDTMQLYEKCYDDKFVYAKDAIDETSLQIQGLKNVIPQSGDGLHQSPSPWHCANTQHDPHNRHLEVQAEGLKDLLGINGGSPKQGRWRKNEITEYEGIGKDARSLIGGSVAEI